MAEVPMKYMFEEPNTSLDDRVRALELKYTRLTVWTTVITFLLVAVIVAAVVVQIILNGKAPIPVESPDAALHRHAQRSLDGKSAAITFREPLEDTCCKELEAKIDEQKLRPIISELEQLRSKIEAIGRPDTPVQRTGHHHPPAGDAGGRGTPPKETHVQVPNSKEYDYDGSGDDDIFIDPTYDYTLNEYDEVDGSGVGGSFSDDEDISEVGSGCPIFARPICSDGCVSSVLQDGCPVPICCKAVPEAAPKPHHHHHHRH